MEYGIYVGSLFMRLIKNPEVNRKEDYADNA